MGCAVAVRAVAKQEQSWLSADVALVVVTIVGLGVPVVVGLVDCPADGKLVGVPVVGVHGDHALNPPQVFLDDVAGDLLVGGDGSAAGPQACGRVAVCLGHLTEGEVMPEHAGEVVAAHSAGLAAGGEGGEEGGA